MSKRPYGEGTIYKVESPGKNQGKWIAQLSLGKDKTGKRIRKTRSAKTKKAAYEALQQMRTEAAEMSVVTDSSDAITLNEFASQWLETKRPSISERTLELYQHQLKAHILPVLGHMLLTEIRPQDVRAMMQPLLREDKISTANKCRGQLYSILKTAVNWEMLPKNPVSAIEPIREQAKVKDLWTRDQVIDFITTHRNHRFFPAFYVLLTGGLRRGELLGLRWEDLRPTGVYINYNVVLVDNKPVHKPYPKTKAGRRFVPLPQDTLQLLEAHRKEQQKTISMLGRDWERPDLIFPSAIGTLMNPRNFYREWSAAVKAAGVPSASIHDMRHLNISLLIQAGENLKSISVRAGHATSAFTMDRYGHLLIEQENMKAHTLAALLDIEQEAGESEDSPSDGSL